MYLILRLLASIVVPVSLVLAHNALAFLALVLLVVRQPLDQLAAVPEALLLNKVELVTHVANSILHPVPPEASIRLRAELPRVRPLAMSLVISEFASVLS